MDLLITLDAASPGFLARVMSSGDLRRQAIFAALAQGAINDPRHFLQRLTEQRTPCAVGDAEPLVHVAAVLAHARARVIVAAAFGGCPPRLLAFLRRLGPQPFIGTAYKRLHNLAATPDADSAARYLLGRDQLHILDIEKAERLRPEVLTSKLARNIHTSVEIGRVNTVIEVALQHCSTLTQERLAQSLDDVSEKTMLSDWLYRLIEQFDVLIIDPPFRGDDEAVLLASGPAILDAGRRYKNCMKTLVNDTLAGRSYFYEFPREKVVAQVKMLTDQTGFVDGIYGVANKSVGDKVKRHVRDKLQHYGLPSIETNDDRPSLNLIANLNAPWRFRDLDDEDAE